MSIDEILAQARARRELPEPRRRRALRQAAGVSQDAVAEMVGVCRPTITRWEGGGRTPRGEFAVRYLEALDRLRREVAG